MQLAPKFRIINHGIFGDIIQRTIIKIDHKDKGAADKGDEDEPAIER